jgi:hypothetical protein
MTDEDIQKRMDEIERDIRSSVKAKNYVYWSRICIYDKLSEKFMERHLDNLNWYHVSAYQELSENFIQKYADRICWYNICVHKKISKKLIKKCADKVDSNFICLAYFKINNNFSWKTFL